MWVRDGDGEFLRPRGQRRAPNTTLGFGRTQEQPARTFPSASLPTRVSRDLRPRFGAGTVSQQRPVTSAWGLRPKVAHTLSGSPARFLLSRQNLCNQDSSIQSSANTPAHSHGWPGQPQTRRGLDGSSRRLPTEFPAFPSQLQGTCRATSLPEGDVGPPRPAPSEGTQSDFHREAGQVVGTDAALSPGRHPHSWTGRGMPRASRHRLRRPDGPARRQGTSRARRVLERGRKGQRGPGFWAPDSAAPQSGVRSPTGPRRCEPQGPASHRVSAREEFTVGTSLLGQTALLFPHSSRPKELCSSLKTQPSLPLPRGLCGSC